MFNLFTPSPEQLQEQIKKQSQELSVDLFHAIKEKNLAEVVKALTPQGNPPAIAYVNAARTSDGFTALILAASLGCTDIVNHLLKHKPNLNIRCRNQQNTALHVATLGNYHDIVDELIKAGAAIDQANAEHIRPLYLAAHKGNADIVKLLLSAKADPNLVNTGSKSNAMHAAAESGHVEIIALLHQATGKIDERNQNGYTPLMFAAIMGHTNVIEYLLKHGANPDELTTPHHDTPLHWAAYKDRSEAVAKLLQYGANLTIINQNNKNAREVATPRTLAIIDAQDMNNKKLLEKASQGESSTGDIKKLLLAGAYTHVSNEKGETALHLACKAGNINNVTLLITEGAKCMGTAPHPVFYAIESGNIEIVTLIYDTFKPDAHVTNQAGEPLLYHAIKHRQTESVKFLLNKHPADLDTLSPKLSPIILQGALYLDSITMELLLSKAYSITVSDKQTNTLLHFAARNTQHNLFPLFEAKGIINKLGINTPNVLDYTPVMYAASVGNASAVKTLLALGANVDCIEKEKGKTAVILAAEGKHPAAALLLIYQHLTSSVLYPVEALMGLMRIAGLSKQDLCDLILKRANEACEKGDTKTQIHILERATASDSAIKQLMDKAYNPSFELSFNYQMLRQSNAYQDHYLRTHLPHPSFPPPPYTPKAIAPPMPTATATPFITTTIGNSTERDKINRRINTFKFARSKDNSL